MALKRADILTELREKVLDFKQSNFQKLFLTARFDDFSFTKELLEYCKMENISIESDLGFRYEFSIYRKKNLTGDWIYRMQMPFNFEINLKE